MADRLGTAALKKCPGAADYGDLITIVSAPESRLDDSARFWTAAALCRFFTGRRAMQSGRGLPQSTTLTGHSFARNRLGGRRIFETALGVRQSFMKYKPASLAKQTIKPSRLTRAAMLAVLGLTATTVHATDTNLTWKAEATVKE